MHQAVKICKEFIHEKLLFNETHKLLVAFSGGSDSVALSMILNELDYNIDLAHCNFKLRGNDSDNDELFVKQFAEEKQLKIHLKSFETTKFAKRNKISIEEAARILRYQWFEELSNQYQYDFIVTGHQQDDLIETFFINLTAGAGIRGLKSIPIKNNKIVRPLLNISRSVLIDYCNRNNQNFRTDASNYDITFTRNKIRHQIIPVLKEINPAFNETMSKNIEIYNDFFQIYSNYIKTVVKEVSFTKNELVFIDFERLLNIEAPLTVLYELIASYGFNSTQTKDILTKFPIAQSGKKILSKKGRIIKHGKYLISGPLNNIIEPLKVDENQLGIKINGFKFKLTENKMKFDFSDKNSGFLNADIIQFPLIIRQAEKGDYFYPYGMKGKKLISDFYTDLKLNTFEREQTLLLTSENKILWVIGHRIDDRYKIIGSTLKVLHVTHYKP
jgi:tRNA(Ile)-lysidine synthase